ncbi:MULTISPECIES: shikimate kinase [unclassified Haematospirillum]|uniref:shikimate kinase n=1 Tax=unclassified Haematospirillum TaxID=2622088 RepID=UPI001438A9CB|nr:MULTISPECIES: shikimate kinase [unclassified Haematospirillum]NKD54571.1 shikimate kinase [Haematospirillum sp. H4890]NKD74817.1 shikimate kinase [Haematospirillum sp. H4485]NKD88027.1 shikimate kinase [Haematospirillum sp. 15-248]
MSHDPNQATSPSNCHPPSRSLVLVGLMGAGKSVVGRRLAKQLSLPFHDSDAEVEKAAGCTINDLFSRFGEEDFRAGEAKVIARLLNGAPCVLATGGGAFLAEETRDLITHRAVSIWLRAELDLLVSRTTGRMHRPLLNQGNLQETLERLIRERYPIYASADIVIEAKDESPGMTCRRIRRALAHFTHGSVTDSE